MIRTDYGTRHWWKARLKEAESHPNKSFSWYTTPERERERERERGTYITVLTIRLRKIEKNGCYLLGNSGSGRKRRQPRCCVCGRRCRRSRRCRRFGRRAQSFVSFVSVREREGERGRDDYARRQCVAAATTTLNQQPNSLTTRIIRGHGLQRFFSALIMIIKILNCFGTCLLG